MEYLLSVRPDYVPAGTEDKFAMSGEPVIPGFPAPCDNMFISTTTFRKSIHAIVEDVAIDLDEVCVRLCKEYPGLPKRLIENYIFHTARAASSFAIGTRFRIYIQADNTKLHEVGGEERLFTLWDEQPME